MRGGWHGKGALLLDMDGTLVDSESQHQAAYRTFFDRRGWADDARVDPRNFQGRRGRDGFAEEGPWTGQNPVALEQAVIEIASETAPRPVAGALELVACARADGRKLAVVTSATQAWTDQCLALFGGTDSFDAVVTSECVAVGKPDPAGFALALRLLGADADSACAFEDTPSGVRAALAAGVGTVVGVSTSWTDIDLCEAGAHHVVPDLRGFSRPGC